MRTGGSPDIRMLAATFAVVSLALFATPFLQTDSDGVTDATLTLDDIVYSLSDDGTATVTGYHGEQATLAVPSTINAEGTDRAVVGIGDAAFADNVHLTSVTLSEGLLTIGDDAFSGCTSRRTVAIPSAVDRIGDRAFQGCTSIEGLTIPAGAGYIGQDSFKGVCGVEDGTVPAPGDVIGHVYEDDVCTSCGHSIKTPNVTIRLVATLVVTVLALLVARRIMRKEE